jgi:hypothetical protein
LGEARTAYLKSVVDQQNQQNIVIHFHQDYVARGCIFSRVRPFYECAVSDLDRYMHRSLWVLVAHSSFIEGSNMAKIMAS